MDKYSYSQNSRIAKRIKERERKRRRRKKIIAWIVTCLAIAVFAIFGLKYIPLPDIHDFNPKEGIMRLVSVLKAEKDVNVEPSANTDVSAQEDQTFPSTNAENNTSEGEEATSDIPVLDENDAEPMEKDFWNEDASKEVSTKGIYPPASENNNLLDIFKNAQGETEKICCLTFDDGPNKVTTPQILDILAKHNIKATFFELGEKLAANKELGKRTFDEGHLLANHTYTQKYSTLYTNIDSFLGEVEKTQQLITEVTGEEAYKLVRFPGGSFNSGVYGKVKQEYKTVLAEKGYYFIDWNVDNGDNGNRTSAQILNYVKDYCGSKPIVLLMEDATSRKGTVSSLDSVIKYLKGCGYVFKRLDEISFYSPDTIPQHTNSKTDLKKYNDILFFNVGKLFR